MPVLDQKTRYDSDEDPIVDPQHSLSGDELEQLELKPASEDLENENYSTEESPEQKEQSQVDKNMPDTGDWNTDLGDKQRPKINRKRIASGGAAAGLLAGGMFGLMTVMPNLRLESYMSRINKKAFGIAENAVEARAGHLFRMYLSKKLLSFDDKCGNVVSSKCRGNFSKSGIASSLFEGWSEKNFEGRLFNKLGYKIEYNKKGGDSPFYRLIPIDGKEGGKNPIDLTLTKLSDPDFLNNAGGNELGKEFRKLLKQESKMLSVMDRISIRRGLKKKYDIDTWCFLACDKKDNLKKKKVNAKTRFQKAMIKHIVYKFSGKYGIYFDCLTKTSGGTCTYADLNKKGITKVEKETVEELLEKADKFAGEAGDTLSQRLAKQITSKIAEKLFGESAGKAASSAVPVVGQVYAALSAVDLADQLYAKLERNELSQMAADLNASQYAQYYTSMRSANDELKSHNLTLEEAGAMMEPFMGAEESLVYQANNPVQNNILTHILGGSKAYAATAISSEPYKCADDKPIPEGNLVCEEKKVARKYFIDRWTDNPIFSGTMDALLFNYRAGQGADCKVTCPRWYVHGSLSAINWGIDKASGALLDGALALAGKTPGVNSLITFIQGKMMELMNFIFKLIFPMVISLDSPARELLDGLFAGADVVASEFAKGGYDDSGESYGLGGKALTSTETAAILKEQAEQADYEYNQKKFLAQASDLSRPDSLGTQIVMSTPESLDKIPQTISSNIASLFNGSLINNLVSSLFESRPVYAAVSEATINNPFGVTKYGIPLDDPSLSIDPDELTPEECERFKKERKDSEAPNNITGFPEYSKIDPCLLTQVAAESAGSLFTDAYDKGKSGESQSMESSEPLPGGVVTEADTKVTASGGGIRLHKSIVDKADEMLAAAAADGVSLTGGGWRSGDQQIALRKKNCGANWQTASAGSCNPPTAIPGTSNHEKGLAIDFDNMCFPAATCKGNLGYEWLIANAEKYGFFKLSSEAWHWSVDGK